MGRLGELLVILAIVFMLFGTRRLKDFGSDLGAAIKGFKSSIGEDKSAVPTAASSFEPSFKNPADANLVLDHAAHSNHSGDSSAVSAHSELASECERAIV